MTPSSSHPDTAPRRHSPQGLYREKGYDVDEIRDIVREFGLTAHIRTRGDEAIAIEQAAGFKARRWLVERPHSGMNRFRRRLVRREKLPETFIARLHLACGVIIWRATGLLDVDDLRSRHPLRTGSDKRWMSRTPDGTLMTVKPHG